MSDEKDNGYRDTLNLPKISPFVDPNVVQHEQRLSGLLDRRLLDV